MLVALTGGIGSGKSTVAARWVQNGATEIDADVLAREVVAPGSVGLQLVVDEFSDRILDQDGALDRAKLGQLVFSDPAKRKALESILHPLIQAEARRRTESLSGIVIYTIPLLAEVSSPLKFDRVVTISCPVDVRIDRLVSTRGMDWAEAQARVSSQASDSDREKLADTVIYSDCPLDELLAQADHVFESFLSDE